MIVHSLRALLYFILLLFIGSCKSSTTESKDEEVSSPAALQSAVSDRISNLIEIAGKQKGKWDDDTTTRFFQYAVLTELYRDGSQPRWSVEGKFLPVADSLFGFIGQCKYYGLFPGDYHFPLLDTIRRKFTADSLTRHDRLKPDLWARADVAMSDAFFQLVKDVYIGRLPSDSITLRKNMQLPASFYIEQFNKLKTSGVSYVMQSLEPAHKGYHLLKQGLRQFLAKATEKEFTSVPYPVKDSSVFIRILSKRLYEEGILPSDSAVLDSVKLAGAIKKYQVKKGLAADGRAGEGTIRVLNVNDRERFVRIAISLDKYKMLPEKMPSRYIWVNVSSNYLEVVDKDEVELNSKVICGKPKTRTPLLTSQLTELITYPQWVPPPSIVSKEILPAVKKNPGYLAKRGFSLVDGKGNEVDPYSVDWSRYSKGIPYRVVQGSGDANALGIMKFVFSNKYSVYLHDTNQRYLFGNAMRSLSHGCVRVQEWDKLAKYILRTDSAAALNGKYTPVDSMMTWLENKQKRSIPVRQKLPVFIRNFTCEGKDGSIIFYDDVYAEDRFLREKYFAGK